MEFKRFIKSLIPEPLRNFLLAHRLRGNPYYKRICKLPVNRSGLSEDGIPFVELDGGRIFYGYLPLPHQRLFFRFFVDCKTKTQLEEECINVAYDIILRYLGPDSKTDYLSQGKFYDLTAGDTVVEVGAYIGYYAMRAAQLVGESGRVIAIEAIGENFQLLKKNVETNCFRNISIVPKAAWDSTGTLEFYRYTRQQASAVSTVINVHEEITTVSCDTVDNILKELKVSHANFVRIQVNGAEREVLGGMSETLKQYPKLLIAAMYARDGQPSLREIKPYLESKGYATLVQQGNIFAKKAE